MRRETQNVLLVLLGGALLKIGTTGDYLRYVKPSLLPFLLLAGGVMVTLGLLAIVRDVRAGRAGAQHDEPDDHDHAGRSPWLLLAPVLAIFLIAPPALGADSVTRAEPAVGAPARSGVDFDALPGGAAPALRIGDLVTRAVWDDTGSLDGRQVRLSGFVVHHEDGTTSLARLTISCCAADARPVRVRLAGDGSIAAQIAAAPQDAWFEVRGEVVPDSANRTNRFVPTFAASGLTPIPAPAEPYEF